MYYTGKMIDLFEMAMIQLLESAGYPVIKHIDCISRRCFGYEVGGVVKNWFSPTVKMSKAIMYIAEETGVKINCTKAETAEDIAKMCDEYRTVLIGPVKGGVAAPLMKDYYYNGASRYLIISGMESGGYSVSDPQGIPELYIAESDIENFIEDTYTVFINGKGEVRQPDARYILRQGLEYHEKIQDRERSELIRAAGMYCGGRGQQISLAYAVMNLALQLDKVFWLTDDAGILNKTMIQEYIMLKQQLYQSGQQEEPERISEIVENVWRLLKNAGEI